MKMYYTDGVECICPYCSKHFEIKMSNDKLGIRAYRKDEDLG